MRFVTLFFLMLGGPALAITPAELVQEALKNNPELRFYEKQIAALPKTSAMELPVITQPLAFPSQGEMRTAVLNLDAALAREYLEEFRFVLGGTVRLKAIEYQGAAEVAETAHDLAARIGALVKMLEQRPAAGVEALIERRILEGAALPFIRQAAESSLRASLLRTELNGLLGRAAEAELTVDGSFVALPPASGEPAGAPLLLRLREAELARGLLGINAAGEVESFSLGAWFTREGLGAHEILEGVTRPGGVAGSSVGETKARLLADAEAKMARERLQRQRSVGAAAGVLQAIPSTLIENLGKASDLAERQYRVGALGVNLLLEAHREYLAALVSRNEATLQAWRNLLDLEFLNFAPTGALTQQPKPPTK